MVNHGCLFSKRKPWGSTWETPKRKPGEPPGNKVRQEMPFASSFLTPTEKGGTAKKGLPLEWHSRGRRFDSVWLHHPPPIENACRSPISGFSAMVSANQCSIE